MMYGKETISMNNVRAVLNSKEIQTKVGQNQDSSSELLFVRGRTEDRGSKGKGKARSKSKVSRKCFHCHKEGHFRKDCLERKQWKKSQPSGGEVSVASCSKDFSEVLVTSSSKMEHEWVIDSRCSFHMCPRKEWFHQIQEEDGVVLLGDNKECRILGVGTIRLMMFDGCTRELSNVRYVPDLKRNLISVGTLDSHGRTMKIEKGTIKVIRGVMTMMKGIMRNGLYVLVGHTAIGTVAVAEQARMSSAQLWHHRLGHISYKGLEELRRRQLLLGDIIQELEFYESCVIGKSHKVKFTQGTHTSNGILYYVHVELWGPSKTQSKGGAKYFLSIVDDYSRRVWTYLIRSKDMALQKFKD